VAFPAPQIITRRWFNPCHGGDPVLPTSVTTSTTTPATTTSGSHNTASGLPTTSGSAVTPTNADLADSFHVISTKATRLKRHVRELKDLYVSTTLRSFYNL